MESAARRRRPRAGADEPTDAMEAMPVVLQLTALTFQVRMPSTAAKAVRLVAALAAAFAFTFPLLTTLHTWVPGTKQRALYEPRPSDRLLPFEIDGKAQLLVQDLPALTSHQRILLMIATFRTEPRLIGADLTFAG